jgi:hypothetical protein
MAYPACCSVSPPLPNLYETAEVDKVKDKSTKRDIPLALRRGTIGQVTTHHLHAPSTAALGYARPARRRG